ncbi:MAG TPA: chalcone isomerase family protein [Gammaproteobacteria bacterium]|nr:chalcone isomerase family protein [Gammaproteobacteria bacterium]
MRSLAAFLLSLALAAPAFAVTVAGVDVPDTATVANTPLVLNGAGVRVRFFFKIYAGGLYLPQKSSDPAAIVASTGPDRILMHMIYDGVSKSQFADAWHDDFKANNPADYDKLHDQIEQFISWFGDSKKGDVITMDYVPGTGTQVSWNGVLKGTIPGEAFHKALLNVYMGPNPPTSSLKESMLGKD